MRILLLAVLVSLPCFPQLTVEQRLFDFEHITAQLAKFYAPYEWKKQLLGFDMYSIGPWLDRVRNAKSDLEYHEIAAEYVASLKDTHARYYIPSDFVASIGMSVDLYDGKYLIEAITRTQLPASRYPFAIGDEIVSIDGKTPADLVDWISKYSAYSNDRATKRISASRLFLRVQETLPRAHEIGDTASVVVRRSSGDVETYEIPWVKRGVPLINNGPLPSPLTTRGKVAPATAQTGLRELLARYQNREVPVERLRLLGVGARTPIFTLPANFQRRLGTSNAHFHFSGTYIAEGKRIGYLRIPSFSPPNRNNAFVELFNEIDFLQRNTDGLIVDVTRNPGGGCYGQDAAQLLIPHRFQSIADEIRPSRSDVASWEFALNSPPPANFEEWELNLAKAIYAQLSAAYSENRGRTGPLPTCGLSSEVEPIRNNRDGSVFAYTKPLILLTDELSISWADSFAQIISDAKRGPLFGYRTNGAGGSVTGFYGGFHAEAFLDATISLGVRAQAYQQPGFPATTYYENVGIWPDIPYDIMTAENLTSGYAPYVQAFTTAIVREINKEAK